MNRRTAMKGCTRVGCTMPAFLWCRVKTNMPAGHWCVNLWRSRQGARGLPPGLLRLRLAALGSKMNQRTWLAQNLFRRVNIFWQHHDLHLQRRIRLNRVSKTSVPPLYFHLVKKKIAMSTFGETAGNRKGITLLLWFLTGQHMARKGMGWTTKG